VIFEVGAVLGSPGSIAAKELKKGGGAVVMFVEEATGCGELVFQLRGLDLKNMDGLFNKSDPFFELQRLRRSVRTGARVWDCVFRGTPVRNDLNPLWNECRIDLDTLCAGNTGQKFRIAVYDYDDSGRHDSMGEVTLSVDEMVEAATPNALGDKLKVSTDKAFALRKSGKEVGKLVVAKAEVSGADASVARAAGEEVPEADVVVTADEEEDIDVASEGEEIVMEASDAKPIEPTFVNYVRGGCQLQVAVAVDATASNGDPRKPGTLHHFADGGRNGYEEALHALCTTLAKYDSDQKYPVFGFGAKPGGVGATVSHCFPLGGIDAEEVDGVDGILDVYRKAFRAGIVMSSPRDFSEAIRVAADDAETRMVSGKSIMMPGIGPQHTADF